MSFNTRGLLEAFGPLVSQDFLMCQKAERQKGFDALAEGNVDVVEFCQGYERVLMRKACDVITSSPPAKEHLPESLVDLLMCSKGNDFEPAKMDPIVCRLPPSKFLKSPGCVLVSGQHVFSYYKFIFTGAQKSWVLFDMTVLGLLDGSVFPLHIGASMLEKLSGDIQAKEDRIRSTSHHWRSVLQTELKSHFAGMTAAEQAQLHEQYFFGPRFLRYLFDPKEDWKGLPGHQCFDKLTHPKDSGNSELINALKSLLGTFGIVPSPLLYKKPEDLGALIKRVANEEVFEMCERLGQLLPSMEAGPNVKMWLAFEKGNPGMLRAFAMMPVAMRLLGQPLLFLALLSHMAGTKGFLNEGDTKSMLAAMGPAFSFLQGVMQSCKHMPVVGSSKLRAVLEWTAGGGLADAECIVEMRETKKANFPAKARKPKKADGEDEDEVDEAKRAAELAAAPKFDEDSLSKDAVFDFLLENVVKQRPETLLQSALSFCLLCYDSGALDKLRGEVTKLEEETKTEEYERKKQTDKDKKALTLAKMRKKLVLAELLLAMMTRRGKKVADENNDDDEDDEEHEEGEEGKADKPKGVEEQPFRLARFDVQVNSPRSFNQSLLKCIKETANYTKGGAWLPNKSTHKRK